MEELKDILKKRYPTCLEDEVKEINTIFSISPHANEKYVVKPKFNILHPLAVTLVYFSISNPLSLPITFPSSVLLGYGLLVTKDSHVHELSHAYRMRYLSFMREVRGGKKNSRYVDFVDKLERIARDSPNKVKSFLAREASLLLSIPVVAPRALLKGLGGDKMWYWEEEIAKYETEKFSGTKVNRVSPEKKKFFEILESFRTDEYVPLKESEETKELDEKLRFFLEHPPAIMPKYKALDKLYETFKREERSMEN